MEICYFLDKFQLNYLHKFTQHIIKLTFFHLNVYNEMVMV